jgi:hypothetical protein
MKIRQTGQRRSEPQSAVNYGVEDDGVQSTLLQDLGSRSWVWRRVREAKPVREILQRNVDLYRRKIADSAWLGAVPRGITGA